LWLTDSAKDDKKLKGMIGQRPFKLVYRFSEGSTGTARTYNYFRADIHRNATKPFKTEKKHAISTGSVEFNLMKLGEDESAWTVFLVNGSDRKRTPFAFDATITVYIKVGYKFVNNPKDPKDKWDDAKRNDFIGGVTSEFRPLSRHYYLNLADDKIRPDPDGRIDRDFKNVKVVFIHLGLNNQPSSRTDYDVKVVKGSGAKIIKRNGKAIEVGDQISKVWIANYLLGKDDGLSEAPITLITADKRVKHTDLTFVRDWVRLQVGNDKFEHKTTFA
jgi:hypothetical protein